MRIFALLLVVGIIVLRGLDVHEKAPVHAPVNAGPCVLTAADLVSRHPRSRILFVRYFGQPLGHAYAAWKQGNKVVLADHRGTVTMPALAWDSPYVMATHAVPPNESFIFSTAAYVYEGKK